MSSLSLMLFGVLKSRASKAVACKEKDNSLASKLLSYYGTADGIRTHDLQSRSLALYPAELQPQIGIKERIAFTPGIWYNSKSKWHYSR